MGSSAAHSTHNLQTRLPDLPEQAQNAVDRLTHLARYGWLYLGLRKFNCALVGSWNKIVQCRTEEGRRDLACAKAHESHRREFGQLTSRQTWHA